MRNMYKFLGLSLFAALAFGVVGCDDDDDDDKSNVKCDGGDCGCDGGVCGNEGDGCDGGDCGGGGSAGSDCDGGDCGGGGSAGSDCDGGNCGGGGSAGGWEEDCGDSDASRALGMLCKGDVNSSCSTVQEIFPGSVTLDTYGTYIRYVRFSLSTKSKVTLTTSKPDSSFDEVHDSHMYLLQGSCDDLEDLNLTEIAENDDGGAGRYSEITQILDAGHYFVAVDGGDTQGSFVLTMTSEAYTPACGDKYCDPATETAENCIDDCDR